MSALVRAFEAGQHLRVTAQLSAAYVRPSS